MNPFPARPAMAVLATLLFLTGGCGVSGGSRAETARDAGLEALAEDSAFGRAVARLSGPGAYFDTDNLISNERSYLHATGALRSLAPGGVYVGVGPDQNFSYIAAARPELAVIVDIRRDNLLQHLLLKALLDIAPTRVEFLSRLTGRPPPADPAEWRDRTARALVERVDGFPKAPAASRAAALQRVAASVGGYGIALSAADRRTIRRFHETFIREGLSLRFRSHERAPRPYYPTYRQLILETDREGRPAGFLARERDYAFVRGLSRENRILPVVGDLAGDHALSELAHFLEERGLELSALYASNVEYYLARQGTLDRFVANLERLPRRPDALLVRSYFGGVYGAPHPLRVPGYATVQLTQPVEALLRGWEEGRIRGYRDLLTGDVPRSTPADERLGAAPRLTTATPARLSLFIGKEPLSGF